MIGCKIPWGNLKETMFQVLSILHLQTFLGRKKVVFSSLKEAVVAERFIFSIKPENNRWRRNDLVLISGVSILFDSTWPNQALK